jgi:hypothetical protein
LGLPSLDTSRHILSQIQADVCSREDGEAIDSQGRV